MACDRFTNCNLMGWAPDPDPSGRRGTIEFDFGGSSFISIPDSEIVEVAKRVRDDDSMVIMMMMKVTKKMGQKDVTAIPYLLE